MKSLLQIKSSLNEKTFGFHNICSALNNLSPYVVFVVIKSIFIDILLTLLSFSGVKIFAKVNTGISFPCRHQSLEISMEISTVRLGGMGSQKWSPSREAPLPRPPVLIRTPWFLSVGKGHNYHRYIRTSRLNTYRISFVRCMKTLVFVSFYQQY